jgi:hypothetical protein
MTEVRGNLKKTMSLAVVVCLALSAPVLAKDKQEAALPKIDKSGLHLQENTQAKAVYALPGASLAQYDSVLLVDSYVQFVDKWQRHYNLNEVGLAGQVSDKDMEAIKSKVAAEFKSVFTKVLTDAGHQVVTEAGDNVLVVRPAIINLDPAAPDLKREWRTSIVSSAGSMTLYMELYDSNTDTLLARIIDPQADNDPMGKPANSVTNKAAADLILTKWAKQLEKHLGSAQKASS